SGRARDGNGEVLAHHVLAGDHFFDAAALFVEHDRRQLSQRVARFVERAAVRIHSGQLLDEADVTVVRLEVHRGKSNLTLFHSRSPARVRQGYAKTLAFV